VKTVSEIVSGESQGEYFLFAYIKPNSNIISVMCLQECIMWAQLASRHSLICKLQHDSKSRLTFCHTSHGYLSRKSQNFIFIFSAYMTYTRVNGGSNYDQLVAPEVPARISMQKAKSGARRRHEVGSSVAGGRGALPLLCSFASRVHRVCSDVCLNRWLWWRRALQSARWACP